MTTAADLIAALNRRRTLKSLRPEELGKLPPGWQRWLDAQPAVDGHAPGSPAPEWVDAFLRRPLRAIPRSPAEMGRMGALSSLLQQNWTPNVRDERGLRIGVSVVDVILHLVLAGLLLWLMYLRFMALAQQPQEDEAVQVEFIGRGNAAEGGGALAAEGADSAPAAAAPATRAAVPAASPAPAAGRPEAAAIERVAVPLPPALAAEVDISRRAPPLPVPVETTEAVEAAQPLQVSEVPAPEPERFQLPPPKQAALALPQAELREPQPRRQVEEVPTLQPQPVRTLQPREAQARIDVPQLRDQPRALEVPEPQRMQPIAERATPAIANRQAQLGVPEYRGELREIPMPPGGAPTPSSQAGSGNAASAAAASGAGGERGNAPAAGQAASGAGAGKRAASESGRGVGHAGAGAGSALKPAPGGWPGAAKSDDWGAASRNVAGTGNGSGRDGDGGNGNGLFDKDGSVRLPDAWSDNNIDIDQAGTWLKRPGLEYRGTRFDKYWIPQGNLLEEWVRRGIKKVSIPIPGTGTHLECVVSLLQLGGGCFPVNPDVNEQSSTGRPPPDVPFKPELQEDNGSVRPQDAPDEPLPAPLPGG